MIESYLHSAQCRAEAAGLLQGKWHSPRFFKRIEFVWWGWAKRYYGAGNYTGGPRDELLFKWLSIGPLELRVWFWVHVYRPLEQR